MSNEIEDFYRDPWTLRAIHVEAIVTGSESFANDTSVWMWFIGDADKDEWFAHGLSDVANDDTADAIESITDDAEIRALLPYAGEPWENLMAINPVAFAGQQRELYVALARTGGLDRIKDMTRDDIKRLRFFEQGPKKAWLN